MARRLGVITLVTCLVALLLVPPVHALGMQHPAVAIEATPDGQGYWVVTTHGEVHPYGTAPRHGAAPEEAGGSIIGFAATPDGGGYWLAASDGSVYPFGNAVDLGGSPATFAGAISAFAATPDGTGYWLATASGEVFAYGSAADLGGTPPDLDGPVVAMEAAAGGDGYWLVTATGQVHAFGSATDHGDAGTEHRGTIAAMAALPDGSGYWLLSADGQVLDYGKAPALGHAPPRGNAPLVALAVFPSGSGYWLLTADHQVFPFGDAPFLGTLLLAGSYVRGYPSFTGTIGSWGGYDNGRVPPDALCPVGRGGHRLRCDAAVALLALDEAFEAEFGEAIAFTDTYRSFEGQVRTRTRWCQLDDCRKAATPGTSNHGWGLAVDFGSGINRFDTPQHRWMQEHAGRFGWIHPEWAQRGGSNEEPWHWEFIGTG